MGDYVMYKYKEANIASIIMHLCSDQMINGLALRQNQTLRQNFSVYNVMQWPSQTAPFFGYI